MNPRRVATLILRHYYLYRASWPRVLELVYWPVMNLLLWGFLSLYLRDLGPEMPKVVPMLLGALIFWDVLFRSQLGVTMAFLEEVWSRNLANLFVTPLTTAEFVLAQLTVGVLRAAISVSAVSLLAGLWYHFNLFDLGLPLVAFFANLLVMGWAIGLLVSGLVLRFGQGAESLAWAIIFAFQPIAAVFYPVSVLPGWLQGVARATPAANVFEGMRALVLDGRFDLTLFTRACVLNAIYLTLGVAFFTWMFRVARRRGLLLQVGE